MKEPINAHALSDAYAKAMGLSDELARDHMAQTLSVYEGEEVFINDEGIMPSCDYCGRPQLSVGNDWNGETGNHKSCEKVN